LTAVKPDNEIMIVKQAKRKILESKGWRVGTAADFLGLTPEEETYIEMKISLSRMLKAKRAQRCMSQVELAELINSSQSRVAKMEAADVSVSIDLLIRSLLVLGASATDLAQAIRTSAKAA
jgi:ribosome-binding protein aMBF1 (putative translation factor)